MGTEHWSNKKRGGHESCAMSVWFQMCTDVREARIAKRLRGANENSSQNMKTKWIKQSTSSVSFSHQEEGVHR